MSLSLRMQERFERRSTARLVVAIVYIFSGLVYLGWRVTTFNQSALTLSYLFYFADIIAFVMGLSVIYITRKYRHRVSPQVSPGLSVDVFIPVYKEPIGIIRQTLIAAKGIDYPHKTWVLDDGQRDEIRFLAEELGCRYLARGDNQFAKAGNLNYGLKHSKGEFIAVFDADFVAMPHALHTMLGFFQNENVGMVQAPQEFYNVDSAFSFISNKKTGATWNDLSFFFNMGQPCRDALDSGTCVGTCVVYRRSALQEIGGIPTETITEDTHTSLKLHKLGHETVIINEPVAYGVDAADLADYYKTRLRMGSREFSSVKRREYSLFK